MYGTLSAQLQEFQQEAPPVEASSAVAMKKEASMRETFSGSSWERRVEWV